MPIGSGNAPAKFQSFINYIFHDCLGDFLVIYKNDFLILSKDNESR